jgi:transcriptional regulator of acetoin/glycerol metabolism
MHSTFPSCRQTAPSLDGIEPTEIHEILADLPGERAVPSHWRDAAMIERCEWALRETAGDTAAASKLLRISRYTLYRWLRRRREPDYGREKKMLRDR